MESRCVNSSPRSAQPSLLISRMNICTVLLMSGKGWRRSSEPDGMSPILFGALDGKHIVMKKPKKSCSDYYNSKGFLPLVLLALVNTKYRFIWVNVGSSGSSSDAQIFNRSDLKEKIEDGTMVLPAPEPLGEGGRDLHYFFLGETHLPRCHGW